MTRKTYCGNLLWQSGLTLLAPLLAAGAMLGGCKTGMFAPRTGELFQTTRATPCPGAATVYMAPMIAGMWGLQTSGCQWMSLFLIPGVPIAAAGYVVDQFAVSPLVDVVCLPYDLCQPNHGFYIRIVDERGQPVPGATVEGEMEGLPSDKKFSGTTDEAGEFYINKLLNVSGFVDASCPGYTPWWHNHHFKTEDAKPGPDGRIAFKFVLSKVTPGAWKAKTGISRDEVLKLLPGKWSADPESRRWLSDGFECEVADKPDRHCFTLDAAGTVVSRVPVGYDFYFGHGESSISGSYSYWSLEGKGMTRSRGGDKDHDSPKEWTWRVRLFKNPKFFSDAYSAYYYLGEDEKGLYLSPGPFGNRSLCEKVSLKFRKATE